MTINKVTIKLVHEESTEYNKTTIKNAIDVVKLVDSLEDIKDNDVETCYIICLNTKNEPTNYSLISKGAINKSIIDVKTIFKNVFLSNASGFILVHNHPSGNSDPSKEDIETTKKLKESSKMLDIKFLDHIIIGQNSFTSIMESELI